MLTTADAALFLGVRPVTVRAWIRLGKLNRQADGLLNATDLLHALDSRDKKMAELASKRWHLG